MVYDPSDDSDIEMILPSASSAPPARAATGNGTGFIRPTINQSSSLPAVLPTTASKNLSSVGGINNKPSYSRSSEPTRDVINIDSGDESEAELPEETTSYVQYLQAMSNNIKAKDLQPNTFTRLDSGSDSDELPDISSAIRAPQRPMDISRELTGTEKDSGWKDLATTAISLYQTSNVTSQATSRRLTDAANTASNVASKKRRREEDDEHTHSQEASAPTMTKTKQKELEREAKKVAKAKEKADLAKEKASRMKAANNRLTRDTSCPEISLDISTTLLADSTFQAKVLLDLNARLELLEVRHPTTENGKGRNPNPACHPKILHWKRTVKKDWDPINRHWKPREIIDYTIEEEKTVLIYLDSSDVERAMLVSKGLVERGSSASAQTLIDIVSNARRAHEPDYQVFLMLQNLGDRQKASNRAQNADWRATATNTANTTRPRKKDNFDPRVTMEDIEMELVRVTVAERCFVIRCEKFEETVDWLVELTKDISYRPYKKIERAREAVLNIDGRVESSKRGHLPTTYQNQLACINGVTEACAVAISRVYPSWRQLMLAYAACRTLNDKYLMLSDIPIGHKTNGAATDKCIGKALSERIYIVLFTRNKNLDLTGDLKTVRSKLN